MYSIVHVIIITSPEIDYYCIKNRNVPSGAGMISKSCGSLEGLMVQLWATGHRRD